MDYIHSFLKYIKFEKRGSLHTATAYESDLSQFHNYLASEQITDWTQVTPKHIRQWMVNMLDGGTAARSVNRKVATLRSFYRFLQREGAIETNPTEKIVSAKTPKRLPVFVREAEMDSLLDDVAFDDSYEGERNHLIIDLFYVTGMRLSELVGLRDVDIDMSGEVIKVTGKRNKQRIVPFSKSTKEAIQKYFLIRDAHFGNVAQPNFLLTSKGSPIYTKLVYRVVKKYLTLVTTVGKKSPHVLRHSFATALLNNGAELNAIKELLGHSSLAATQVYTHNSFEKLNSIYQQAHPRA
ncbi:MAG: tyrosine-type recombinase/integrase [Breznakibacter sp.]